MTVPPGVPPESNDEFFDAVDTLEPPSTVELEQPASEPARRERLPSGGLERPASDLAATLAKRLAKETQTARKTPGALDLLSPGGPMRRGHVETEVWLELPLWVVDHGRFQQALDRAVRGGLCVDVDREITPGGMRRVASNPELPGAKGSGGAGGMAGVWLAGTDEAVVAARMRLMELANQLAGSLSPCNEGRRGRRDNTLGRLQIFVDHSNIFLGASYALGPTRDRSDKTARLEVGRLVEYVEGGRPTAVKKVVGANPPPPDMMWEEWRQHGYDVRTAYTLGNAEQFVDDVLHSEILRTLLLHDTPQTLVLLSGDGNPNGGGTTFPWCCSEALRRGWRVEVHCWAGGLSSEYVRLQRAHPTHMAIYPFDAARWLLTYREPRAPPPEQRMAGNLRSPTYVGQPSHLPDQPLRSPSPTGRNRNRLSGDRAPHSPSRGPQSPATPTRPPPQFPSHGRGPFSPGMPQPSGAGRGRQRKDPQVVPCWRGTNCRNPTCPNAHPNGSAAQPASPKPMAARRQSLSMDCLPTRGLGGMGGVVEGLVDPQTDSAISAQPQASPPQQPQQIPTLGVQSASFSFSAEDILGLAGPNACGPVPARAASEEPLDVLPQRRPSLGASRLAEQRAQVFATCRRLLVAGDNHKPLADKLQHSNPPLDLDECGVVLRGAEAMTLLMAAARYGRAGCVQVLVGMGAALDVAQRGAGCTALHHAAIHGHVEVAAILLAAGASQHVTTANGETALNLARRFGHATLEHVLVDEAGDKPPAPKAAANQNGPLSPARSLAAKLGGGKAQSPAMSPASKKRAMATM